MKKNAFRVGLVLCCTMLVIGGCANKGAIKSEESLAAQQSKAEQQKIDRLAAERQHSDSASRSGSNASGKETITLKPIPGASELKAALDVIYFDFDSYTLSQKARNALVKNAEIMQKDASLTVRIEGHCDERGSDEYNLALGERRARSAMQYLVTMGIPEARLSVISYGKEKPVADGHDEASWAKNRRDEFVIITK